VGWLCRMFREEPLARPCVSQVEPSNSRPKPVTRVPETPPLTRTRAGFSFWRMTRLSAQLPGGLLNSQIDRSAESAHRKLSGSLW